MERPTLLARAAGRQLVSPARNEAHRLRPNARLRQRSEPGTKQQTWVRAGCSLPTLTVYAITSAVSCCVGRFQAARIQPDTHVARPTRAALFLARIPPKRAASQHSNFGVNN